MGDIAKGPIGQIGEYEVVFKAGKLVAKASIGAQVGNGILSVKNDLDIEIDGGAILDALKKVIPGEVDDVLLEILKNALKQIP